MDLLVNGLKTKSARPWLLVVSCLLTVSLCATLYQTRRFYFFSDDFLNFVIASDMGLTRAYLVRDVFGQFVPLYRLINYLYLRCFGLAFWPFRLMLVMFHWVMILVVYRFGAERRMDGSSLLILLAFVAFSPVFATTQQWWSAAVSVLVAAAAITVAVFVGLRGPYLRRRDRAFIALLFFVGLATYPKVLITIIPLLSVRLFARLQGRDAGFFKMTMAAAADLWPVMVIALAYAIIVSAGGYSAGVTRPTLSVMCAFIWRAWNRGFLANGLGIAPDPSFVLVVFNILVLYFVATCIIRAPRSVVLWLGFIAYFVVSTGLIAWNRAVVFGLEVADTGRYYVDALCLFILFSIASLGEQGRSARSQPKDPNRSSVSVACVTSFLLIAATGRVSHLWYAGPEKPAAFVANMRAGLAEAGRNDLLNATMVVPGYVMPAWMWPLNQYKYFVPLFGRRPSAAFSPARGIYIRDDGTLKAHDRK